MKYVALVVVFLVAWLLVDRVLSHDSDPGRRLSLRERWRGLRSRIHVAVDIVAALILIVFLLRLAFQALVGE
jgi:hypothetical protein